MEIITGRHTSTIGGAELLRRSAGYQRVLLDLGTGDGRFVEHLGRTQLHSYVIGVDACREELRTAARRAGANVLFVIASAQALPAELDGLAAGITINFPWGSLIRSLLAGDPALLDGLRRVALPGATLELRLNAGALLEAGVGLEQGGAQIRAALRRSGLAVGPLVPMDARGLRAYPTSWAKRLAFGRDPRALALIAQWPAGPKREAPPWSAQGGALRE